MLTRACFRLWKMSSQQACGIVQSSSKQRHCSGDKETSYEKAIETLNALQVPLRDQKGHTPLTFEDKFAEIKNLPVDELKSLAAIHVAGTKGKGSVCAFSESILRSNGYKTGLYSSPHILEVRERIRINGRSISKPLFARYFWECWEKFEEEKKHFYKTFLVFMAFHVFLKENVDAAVVEVGCGGEYDATNVLRHPIVCGVTLLDKDHWKSLGGSVESIAWHKSGIFKPGVPAFTVPQDPVSTKVLEERAKERQTSLKIVPDLLMYPDSSSLVLGIEGKHQLHNASLAVQLCQTWIEHRDQDRKIARMNEVCSSEDLAHANVFLLPESFKEGLAKTYWPGRSQCVERENITFYIDGAHTRKSIEACVQWFCEKSEDERLRKSLHSVARVLIFNFKGDRDARSLMQPLVKCNFDSVLFCPNILNNEPLSRSSDTSNFYQDPEEVRQKCFMSQEIWREILQTSSAPSESRVFLCVSDAVDWLLPSSSASSIHDVIDASHLQVFVTGSLYLVSMVLRLLDEDIEHIIEIL